MSEAFQHDAAELQRVFHRQEWLHLPSFVRLAEATSWNDSTQTLPGRLLHNNGRPGWIEQHVPDSHPLRHWLTSESLVRFLNNVSQPPNACLIQETLWLNRYQPHGYIPEHKDGDASGDYKLLVYLDADPREGGMLVIAPDATDPIGLALSTGDAVFFHATKISHWTTELTATGERAVPQRVVAVAGYDQHKP